MKAKFMKKSIFLTTLTVVLIYVGFQVYSVSCRGIKTEIAQKAKMTDSIETVGYIVRDEEQVNTETDGVLNFVLNDGDKVEKGGMIAEAYRSEKEILAKKKMKNIDSQIQKLSSLGNSSELASTSPNTLENRVHGDMNVILKDMNDGEYQKTFKKKDKLLYLINQRQLIIGKTHDFSGKINELNESKKDLTKVNIKSINSIIASKSGYFVGHTDGLENSINHAELGKINCKKINELIENAGKAGLKNTAKLVSNSKWYVLCNLKPADAEKLSEGACVKIYMPLANSETIDAKIVTINPENKNGRSAVVLECNCINKNILSLRKEPLVINVSEYGGIRVDKRAIHEKTVKVKEKDENGNEYEKEKRVKGVYTVCGKQLIFKEAEIVYSGKNYVICKLEPEDAFNKNAIKVYDEIVIEGTDLYDRKIIK